MPLTLEQKYATLEMLKSMDKIDAMQCAYGYYELFDIRLDWHQFSDYLEELLRKGLLRYKSAGGFCQYEFNK